MAARKPAGGFNQDYLRRTSKDKFLAAHKHLADNGFSTDDLTKIWQDAQPKSSKPEKEEK